MQRRARHERHPGRPHLQRLQLDLPPDSGRWPAFAIGRWGIRSMMEPRRRGRSRRVLAHEPGRVVRRLRCSRTPNAGRHRGRLRRQSSRLSGPGLELVHPLSRSRAMALILARRGSRRLLHPEQVLCSGRSSEVADWRRGWLIIAGISATGRRPGSPLHARRHLSEGRARAGRRPRRRPSETRERRSTSGPNRPAANGPRRSPCSTSQFYVLIGLSIAYGVPWGIISRLRPPPSRMLSASPLADGGFDPRAPACWSACSADLSAFARRLHDAADACSASS